MEIIHDQQQARMTEGRKGRERRYRREGWKWSKEELRVESIEGKKENKRLWKDDT